MSGKVLTAKAVENAKPDPLRRVEIPDGLLPGLYLVVQPSGARSWAARYRHEGKPRKVTLGAYPALDLAEARKAAQSALRAAAEGRDPAGEKMAARAASRVADTATRDLFENVVADFVARYVKPNNKASSARETERLLTRNVVPVWRGRRVQDIARRDVLDLLDGIVDRGAGIGANRTLAAVRRFFNWCVERDILDKAPTDKVKAPTAERSRDRVLSDDELRIVWRVAGDLGLPFGPMVRLLILTGARRDEVAEARWSEIDVEKRLWTLPAARSKNAVAHEIPLSDAALAVLARVPRIKGRAEKGTVPPDYIFTTTGATAVSGFSRAKTRLDTLLLAEMRKEAKEAGGDPANVETPPRWVIHDLRRTLASGLARLGINLPVIEKILNHTSGSFAGVVGVYQRHSYADEKRAALDAWARFVEGLNEKPAANVVPMRGRG
jgi:integrase